jgi:predicted peroxiredoxin
MSEKLGICVASKGRMEHVLGLAKAAKGAGKEVTIFLTGEGVHLTQDARFATLHDSGKVTVCEVSFLANGFKDKNLPGMRDKDFVTQARNAEMVEECQRYVIL